MLDQGSSSYSRYLKPLPYQCKKCTKRNSTIRGYPCGAMRNKVIMGREHHLINKHMIEQCPYFTPKNKRTCKECDLRFECITS